MSSNIINNPQQTPTQFPGEYARYTQFSPQQAGTINNSINELLSQYGIGLPQLQSMVSSYIGGGQLGAGVPTPAAGQTPGMAPLFGTSAINPLSPANLPAGVPDPSTFANASVQPGLTNVSGTGNPPYPPGSEQTSGGFIVSPGGTGPNSTGLIVYKPGSTGATNSNEVFNMQGDPHVETAQGNTLFSFTKNGDFTLPDGTTIAVQTTAQTGVSQVQQFDITNGNSHVTSTWNSGSNSYNTTPDQNNGISFLANQLSNTANWSGQTYALTTGASGNPVFQEFVGGTDIGKVIGSTQDGSGTWIPTVNSGSRAVATEFQATPGDPDYGNELLANLITGLSNNPALTNGIPSNVLSSLQTGFQTNQMATQLGINTVAGQSLINQQGLGLEVAQSVLGEQVQQQAPQPQTSPYQYTNPYLGGLYGTGAGSLLNNFNTASQAFGTYNQFQMSPVTSFMQYGAIR